MHKCYYTAWRIYIYIKHMCVYIYILYTHIHVTITEIKISNILPIPTCTYFTCVPIPSPWQPPLCVHKFTSVLFCFFRFHIYLKSYCIFFLWLNSLKYLLGTHTLSQMARFHCVCVCVSVYHIFMHLFNAGHLVAFIFGYVYDATIYKGVNVSFQINDVVFGYIPGSGINGSCDISV